MAQMSGIDLQTAAEWVCVFAQKRWCLIENGEFHD